MSKSKNRLIPVLRFSEFKNCGDWEGKILGEIVNRLTKKNTENNQNVLTISAQFGLISQLDFFKKKIASKDVKGYYLL